LGIITAGSKDVPTEFVTEHLADFTTRVSTDKEYMLRSPALFALAEKASRRRKGSVTPGRVVGDYASKTRYMMATIARAKDGSNISRTPADICIIDREEADAYIGLWVTASPDINVRFPRATTRELTAAEKLYWNGHKLRVGKTLHCEIRIEN